MSRKLRIVWLLSAAVPLAVVGGIVWSTRSSESLSPGEQFRRGIEALARGDLDSVARAARALEDDAGYAPHVRLLDVGLLLKSGQPERALAEITRLALADDLREPGLLLMGESLYRTGRLTEAEQVFRQLAREAPDNANARRWLGAIYYDLGANNAALSELIRVTELAPADYAPHRLIGLMLHDFEQHSQAVEHYRQALDRGPPPPVRQEILREAAKSLIAERRYSEALQFLATADDSAVPLALRAECYRNLGRGAEARDALQQARSREADERLVVLLEARILMDEGQPEAAISVLQRTLRESPHDAECRYQLALAYRQLGDHESHEAELARWRQTSELRDRLIELNTEAVKQPRNAAIREQLADVWEMLDNPQMAATWRQAAAACRRVTVIAP